MEHRKFRVFIIAGVILGLALTQGCGGLFCFEVSGPITQWNYHISPFQKIRVYNAPQIYITQGDSQSVVVESEENMFHALQFHIDPFKKLLYVDFDETCIEGIDHFKIFITVDTLKHVDLRGGGEVWVMDTMKTDSLSLVIQGDADIHVNKLLANQVLTEISGSGDIHLSGPDTIQNHSIAITGIGSVYGYDLNCNIVEVNVSGGALIQTSAHQLLDVNISGTSDVYYKGYPTITENITGNGQVIDAN